MKNRQEYLATLTSRSRNVTTSTREPTTRAWIHDVRMAQFVLKIEKLSHIMAPTPILEMARAYGLHPRLWLLRLFNVFLRFQSQSANKTCLRFAIFNFSEKLQNIFEIGLRKCELIVQKKVFWNKKFGDTFLLLICKTSYCQILRAIEQIPFDL